MEGDKEVSELHLTHLYGQLSRKEKKQKIRQTKGYKMRIYKKKRERIKENDLISQNTILKYLVSFQL